MDEVDADPVDLGHVLRHGVEPVLEPAELVVLSPVARELPEERELYALRGVLDELRCGPSHRLDSATQIVDLILRDLDGERRDLGTGCDRGAHDDLPRRRETPRRDPTPPS